MNEKRFLKGDRVYFQAFNGRKSWGVVVEDTNPQYTRVQYDNFPDSFASNTATELLYLDTKLVAEVTAKSYAVEIPDVLKLDNTDLLEDLMRLGAHHIDWSGHYGNYIFFTLNADDEVNTLPRVLNKIESVTL